MAGFSDQSTPRREVDPRAADPGAPLWPGKENPAGNRRVGKLRISGAEGLQETASHSGKVGRPRLVLLAGVMVARVIKCYRRRRVVEVLRRVVAGTEAEVISRVIGTQRSIRALINTSYIERLQATLRARLTPLVRKTRAGAHKQFTLESGMWLVGGCYNFVRAHRTLAEGRTPAMAAGFNAYLRFFREGSAGEQRDLTP